MPSTETPQNLIEQDISHVSYFQTETDLSASNAWLTSNKGLLD